MIRPGQPAGTGLTSSRRRVFIAALFVFFAVFAVGLHLLIRRLEQHLTVGMGRRPQAPVQIDPDQLSDGDDHPLFLNPAFVWDRDVFVRPQSDYSWEMPIRSIDGRRETRALMQHVEHGIVRHEPLGPQPGRPVVLLLGDSHIYGVVTPRQNLYYRLETRLRARPGLEHCTVVNAGCAYYSLYQYVLRARSLWETLKPDLVVAVVFVGNDPVELEDVRRPHLDDALVERPMSRTPPPETTSQRWTRFIEAVPAPHRELFSQGLNQAMFFLDQPDRYDPVLAKARRAIELLDELCRQNGSELLVGLLPSFEDFADYRLPFEPGPSMQPVLAQQVNRRLRLALGTIVESRDVAVVDFFGVLHGADTLDVYAGDYHIWTVGHTLMADELLPVVAGKLGEAG